MPCTATNAATPAATAPAECTASGPNNSPKCANFPITTVAISKVVAPCCSGTSWNLNTKQNLETRISHVRFQRFEKPCAFKLWVGQLDSAFTAPPCSFAPSQSRVTKPVMSPTWKATCMSGKARNKYQCWNLWNHFLGCRASKRSSGIAVL
jgi:hypothetical protein